MNTAHLLFGLRIFPFAVSAVVTVFFTFPSFWLLERTSPDEDTGNFHSCPVLAASFSAPGCSV